jgi:hypothetical protein
MAETEAQRVAAFQELSDQRLESSCRLANAILRDESPRLKPRTFRDWARAPQRFPPGRATPQSRLAVALMIRHRPCCREVT